MCYVSWDSSLSSDEHFLKIYVSLSLGENSRLQDFKTSKDFTTETSNFHKTSKDFKRLQETSRDFTDFTGLHGTSRDFTGLHPTSRDFMGLYGSSWDFMRLHATS
jgi:hypothetical protein